MWRSGRLQSFRRQCGSDLRFGYSHWPERRRLDLIGQRKNLESEPVGWLFRSEYHSGVGYGYRLEYRDDCYCIPIELRSDSNLEYWGCLSDLEDHNCA